MTDQPPVTNVNVNQAPEPSFPITLSAVYYELRNLSTKVDALAGITHEVSDHETRLREVEKNQAYYITKGQAAWAFGALLALVMAVAAVLGLFK